MSARRALTTGCSGFRQADHLSRREALRVGGLVGFGLTLPALLRGQAGFGRTAQINKNAGRDHWPWVYSLVLAGAGIQPGIVYGASDQAAAYPTEQPHDPKDMAATIYHRASTRRSEWTTLGRQCCLSPSCILRPAIGLPRIGV